MTYLRKKEIPPGSDNEYWYEVESIRKGGRVVQKHENYIGKYPDGAGLGTVRRGTMNQQIEKVDQVGATGIWVDPRLDDEKVDAVIQDYKKNATQGQLNSIRRIELYAGDGYSFEVNGTELTSGGHYNHTKGNHIHVYDCDDKSASLITEAVWHESAHNTWNRLNKKAQEEEEEWQKMREEHMGKWYEKRWELKEEKMDYYNNVLSPKRVELDRKVDRGELSREEAHKKLQPYEDKFEEKDEKFNEAISHTINPEDDGHIPTQMEYCPTYKVKEKFIEASKDEPAVSKYADRYKKQAHVKDKHSEDGKFWITHEADHFANENFSDAHKKAHRSTIIQTPVPPGNGITSHGGSKTTVRRTRNYYEKIIEMDENGELDRSD